MINLLGATKVVGTPARREALKAWRERGIEGVSMYGETLDDTWTKEEILGAMLVVARISVKMRGKEAVHGV